MGGWDNEANMATAVAYQDARAWADTKRIHKMGWLRPGDVITVLNEYSGWYKFVPFSGYGADLLPTTDDYPDYWVNIAELGEAPEPPPPPPPPPPDNLNEELGKAFRTLVDYVVQAFKS